MTRVSLGLAGIIAASLCGTAMAKTFAYSGARMSEYIRVLSSDAFEGRVPNTPGETTTVAYLIEQFWLTRLKPGGVIKAGKRT